MRNTQRQTRSTETELPDQELDGPDRRASVQSVTVGFGLLAALAAARRDMMLKDLAGAADMAPAKAHRYLASFIQVGLVEQDAASGRYRLGPFALELGLAAFDQLDVVRVTGETLAALRDQTGESAFLSVWGSHGPTIVRWEEAAHRVTVNVRVGSVLPILRSATGRAFVAHLPPATTAPFIADALRAAGQQADSAAVETARAGITAEVDRNGGIGQALGSLAQGVSAVAGPVRDHRGLVAGMITVLGSQGQFEADPFGGIATALRRATAEASRRLGWTAEGTNGAV